jgi:hypothetical protein
LADLFTPELLRILPELIVIGFGTTLCLAGFWVSRRGLAAISLVGLVAPIVLILASLFAIPGFEWMPQSGVAYGVFDVTAFSQTLKLVFLTVTAIVVLASL